jgi:hypothetical protein
MWVIMRRLALVKPLNAEPTPGSGPVTAVAQLPTQAVDPKPSIPSSCATELALETTAGTATAKRTATPTERHFLGDFIEKEPPKKED